MCCRTLGSQAMLGLVKWCTSSQGHHPKQPHHLAFEVFSTHDHMNTQSSINTSWETWIYFQPNHKKNISCYSAFLMQVCSFSHCNCLCQSESEPRNLSLSYLSCPWLGSSFLAEAKEEAKMGLIFVFVVLNSSALQRKAAASVLYAKNKMSNIQSSFFSIKNSLFYCFYGLSCFGGLSCLIRFTKSSLSCLQLCLLL